MAGCSCCSSRSAVWIFLGGSFFSLSFVEDTFLFLPPLTLQGAVSASASVSSLKRKIKHKGFKPPECKELKQLQSNPMHRDIECFRCIYVECSVMYNTFAATGGILASLLVGVAVSEIFLLLPFPLPRRVFTNPVVLETSSLQAESRTTSDFS